MYNFLLFIHVIVVIGLITLILIQRGRSGGLVEALGGVESIFGTKTSGLFVKATVTLVVLFFFTSISLAYFSKQRSKSLFETMPVREGTVEAEKDDVSQPAGAVPEAASQDTEVSPEGDENIQ